MHGLYAAFWGSLLAMSLPLSGHAADYYRCIDNQGRVSFSDQGCTNGEALDLQPANSLPSPASQTQSRTPGRVSGQKETLSCGGLLDARERRTAMIRQQIRAGMSRADIESALGKPDRVSRHNGLTRYQYTNASGGERTVQFDEHDCVRTKR